MCDRRRKTCSRLLRCVVLCHTRFAERMRAPNRYAQVPDRVTRRRMFGTQSVRQRTQVDSTAGKRLFSCSKIYIECEECTTNTTVIEGLVTADTDVFVITKKESQEWALICNKTVFMTKLQLIFSVNRQKIVGIDDCLYA